MDSQRAIALLLLVVAQAAHAVEDYLTGFFEAFGPARFVSSLLSPDHASGFSVLSAWLVLFGLWCWAVPVRLRWPSANLLLWLWALIALTHSLAHLSLLANRESYVPGLATAPSLFLLGSWLTVLLSRRPPAAPSLA